MQRSQTVGPRGPNLSADPTRRKEPYSDAGLDIRPLDGPLAAEVRGIDLRRPTDAATRKALNDAWAEHLVLLFRGQHFEEDQQLKAILNFGEAQPPNPRTQPPAGEKYPALLRVQHIPGKGDAQEARRLGGNAVVAIDLDYEVLGSNGSMLMVSASGTAVVID